MATKSQGCDRGGDNDVEYTLTVCTPARKKHPLVPGIFSRHHLSKPNAALAYTIPRDPDNPTLYLTNDFKEKHLLGMKAKEVKISQRDLPVQCQHVRKSGSRGCTEGCYVLEEGGEGSDYWKCGREDCQGHVYCDKVAWEAQFDTACFGKKGKRMVCVDKSLGLTLYNHLIRSK
jgi:hypothetical protein